MSSFKEVSDALLNRLATVWVTGTYAGATPVAWGTGAFDPSGLSSWIRATVEPAAGDRPIITGIVGVDGQPSQKGTALTGGLVIQVFVRAGEVGSDDAEATAGAHIAALSEFFRERHITIGAGPSQVTTFVPTPTAVGFRNEWYQINLRIPFEHIVV